MTEFKYLTFEPVSGVKGVTPLVGSKGWGKILTLPCLSTGTSQSWTTVRSFIYNSFEEM